jgi:hypothetical protein
MSHLIVPLLALAMFGGDAAGPEIVNPHRTYGYLGAPRPKTGLLPGDTAYFSFEIKNLKADANGRVAYSTAVVIHDAAGKVIYAQKPHKSIAQRFFGGTTVPAAARIEVPAAIKPGPVSWQVTVTDRTTEKSTVLKGAGEILPPDFGLVQVGTFADAEDHVPTPPVGVVGGHLYLSFGVVGFARGGKDKQPDVKVSLRILDDKNQPTIANPLTGRVNQDVGPDVRFVPLQFALSLDRAGRYTLELSAQDVLSGKTSTVSFPVRILALD